MKSDIHPDNYRLVAAEHNRNDVFITKSTVNSKETIEVDGIGIMVKLNNKNISSLLHGKSKLVDTAGRIVKFKTNIQSLRSNI